jgi:uncharacterized membrane protein YedE/YeeE
MSHFTPLSAAIGGALIGLSAVLLWVGLGRIAGISGILAGLRLPDRAWRVVFLVGLMAAPLLYWLAGGIAVAPVVAASPWVVIAGGLLVGFGTRLGGGCTSGHGVCGIARLSRRSIAATAVFMAAAMATVYVTHHIGVG